MKHLSIDKMLATGGIIETWKGEFSANFNRGVDISQILTKTYLVQTRKANAGKLSTRQLPMGAGHCPWGGYTDQIVCNTHEAPRSNGLGATGLH